MARPGGPTPELQESVVAIIERGSTIKSAFGKCGVPATTQDRWLRRGRRYGADDDVPEEDVPYFRLALAVDRALGSLRVSLTEKIVAAGDGPDGDWRANVALLKATDPEWRSGGGGFNITTQVGVGVVNQPPASDTEYWEEEGRKYREQEASVMAEIGRLRDRFAEDHRRTSVTFNGPYSGTITFAEPIPNPLPTEAHLVRDGDTLRIVFGDLPEPPTPRAPRALPAARPEVIDVASMVLRPFGV